MKKITFLGILACLPFTTLLAQSSCGNRDFEDTTFTGWNAFTGDNTLGLYQPMTWVPGLVTTGHDAILTDANNRHTIITQNTLDPNVFDPMTMALDTQMTTLAPNGGFASVRLGGTTPNYQSEKLTYAFNVTSTDTIFQYQYAVVLNDGGHAAGEQPYMMVNFLDQNGLPIAGACDTIEVGNPNTPFITSSNIGIVYRHWTPQSKSFGGYIGQTITVEFIVAGCIYAGHYGYCYIDASCFGSAIANVWPGDADYDLQANVYDLLSIGQTFNSAGTTRASASNAWTAQPSADWAQHLALGANYKHSDCNGDGVVDLNDTLAIVQNYSLTHPFRLSGNGNPSVTASLPELFLVPVQDTVPGFSYAYVDVYGGTSAQPINNLSGIAFAVNYTNALVQPNTTFTDFGGSWLGVKNSSMLSLAHDDYTTGKNEIGMSRMAHDEVNGFGYLGRIRISTVGVSAYSTIYFSAENIKAVDAFGTTIPLNTTGCTIVIDPNLASGIHSNVQDLHANLFPNPANQVVTISTSSAASKIIITDALGREIYSEISNSQETKVDVSGFSKGIYFVTIYSENAKTTKQLVIAE